MNTPLAESRIPPHSKAAETAVLGAVLINNDVVKTISLILTEEEFYIPSHADIYKCMIDLDEGRSPIDLTTLQAELEKRNLLIKVGGRTTWCSSLPRSRLRLTRSIMPS